MVTDIIDKGEPIRNKLRSLGVEIISDMHSIPAEAGSRIAEAVSFLNIASAMNFISEMNCAILKKEFLELKSSIQEYTDMKPTWLADFFLHPHSPLEKSDSKNARQQSIGHIDHSNGQQTRTRIGVQKGSTLLKAIKDMSNKVPAPYEAEGFRSGSDRSLADSFYILKKQRHNDIINVIKIIGESATIKDIKDKVQANPEQASFLVSCGEKTLQREMVSMVKDGVLNKTGKKRWSRYGLVSSN
jgi:hypothetical protein